MCIPLSDFHPRGQLCVGNEAGKERLRDGKTKGLAAQLREELSSGTRKDGPRPQMISSQELNQIPRTLVHYSLYSSPISRSYGPRAPRATLHHAHPMNYLPCPEM